MIMAYFERKGCVQRNLQSVYHYKNVFKRYRMVRCQVLVIGGDVGQSASGEFQGTVAQRSISA